MNFFINNLMLRPPIQKKYKGTIYAKFPNDPRYCLVFEVGKVPSDAVKQE